MKIKRKTLSFLLLIIAIGIGIYCFLPDSFGSSGLFGSEKKNHVSYSEFYNQIEEGNIASVKISGDKITFKKIGDDKNVFKTENPSSPTLKEKLLLNGIEVHEEKDSGEIISLVFDCIFYAVFIAIIVVAFRKFISPNTFKVVHKTGVSFDNIVGMENLKNDMKTIVQILQNPDVYAKKGIRMPKGILLEGAPGNGKTLFARALAGEAKVNFIPAKATDFESMFMAIGPMKVKLLFRKARRREPCIVFIDEFDGIGTKRNYSGSAIETENTRIVTALLNELDGFEQNNGILVVAATNSRAALDEALIRPGRFDAKYTVPFPDEKSREELVKMYSRNKMPSQDCSPSVLAKKFSGFSCAQIESVINRAAIIASQNGKNEYTMQDIQNALKEV